MKKNFFGELEINLETGDVYFSNEKGETIFRMKGLPIPIPDRAFYDVLYVAGSVSWNSLEKKEKSAYPKRFKEALEQARMGKIELPSRALFERIFASCEQLVCSIKEESEYFEIEITDLQTKRAIVERYFKDRDISEFVVVSIRNLSS